MCTWSGAKVQYRRISRAIKIVNSLTSQSSVVDRYTAASDRSAAVQRASKGNDTLKPGQPWYTTVIPRSDAGQIIGGHGVKYTTIMKNTFTQTL